MATMKRVNMLKHTKRNPNKALFTLVVLGCAGYSMLVGSQPSEVDQSMDIGSTASATTPVTDIVSDNNLNKNIEQAPGAQHPVVASDTAEQPVPDSNTEDSVVDVSEPTSEYAAATAAQVLAPAPIVSSAPVAKLPQAKSVELNEPVIAPTIVEQENVIAPVVEGIT